LLKYFGLIYAADAIAVIGNSLIYQLVDFKSNDVMLNVGIFGVSQLLQLFMVSVAMLFLIVEVSKQNRLFSLGFYLSSGLLLLMQTAPALL
jgi:hypothetical protein